MQIREAEPSPRISFSQWAALTAAFLGWMFDGLEMGLFPLAGQSALRSLLATTDEALVAPWIGKINALFLVGAACGGLLFGWFGDRVGRVRAMSASILTYAIFTGFGYWAQAPWHLAALRFIAALGMGGEWALGVALVMECWPSSLRPLLAGLIGAASNFGFLLIALIGLRYPVTEDSWRWIMLAGAAPALLALAIQSLVPESASWKAAVAKAKDVEPFREVFGPKLRGKTWIAIALGGSALVGTWGSVQWIPSWVGGDLLKYAEPTEKSAARSLAQAAGAFGAIFGCFFGAMLGGRIGRRPVYCLLCFLSLGFCLLMFQGFTTFSSLLLGVIFFVGFTTAAFYGLLPLYLPELFPTRVRATGQGVAFNFGRIIAAVGVLGTGQLAVWSGSYAWAGTMISMVYLVGAGIVWLAPETHGRPLPE